MPLPCFKPVDEIKAAIAPSRLTKDPTLCTPIDLSRKLVEEEDAAFSLLNAIATPVNMSKGEVERNYHPKLIFP